MVVVCDHDSKVLARKTFRCRAWDLGVALDWAADRAAAKGFAGVTVACEPTGHRWRVLGQLAADRSMPFVCVQPIQTSWARRSEDLTFDKTDDKDAVLIARLTAQLRCYVPEPVDETWGRLRHLGARRERLIVEAGAQVRQIRDLLECVWPAALETANWPFRSKTWAAALWVILDRDGGDFTRTRRLGLARFETAVRREITKRGGQRPCLRIVRKLYSALADPTGVLAHRRGALGAGAAAAGGLGRHPTQARRHRDPDDRGARRARASPSWPPPSMGCPRSAPRRSSPRPATRPGSPPPGRWSSTPAWHRGRRSPAPSPAAPSSPARADRSSGWRPGARSGERCRPTPSTPPATDTSPPARPTSSPHPGPKRHRRRDPAAPARGDHHRQRLGPASSPPTAPGARRPPRSRPDQQAAHQADGRGKPYAALRTTSTSSLIAGSPVRRLLNPITRCRAQPDSPLCRDRRRTRHRPERLTQTALR